MTIFTFAVPPDTPPLLVQLGWEVRYRRPRGLDQPSITDPIALKVWATIMRTAEDMAVHLEEVVADKLDEEEWQRHISAYLQEEGLDPTIQLFRLFAVKPLLEHWAYAPYLYAWVMRQALTNALVAYRDYLLLRRRVGIRS